MTTKEICDKSAFREKGYLIEKQKRVWQLSIPFRFGKFLCNIPAYYTEFLDALKSYYSSYYGDGNRSENRLSSFLVRASYTTAKAMSEQKELEEFSAAFRALPYAKNETLSTHTAPVFTFVIKLSENKPLRDFANAAGEAAAMLPAHGMFNAFFRANTPRIGSLDWYNDPKDPPENLQNPLSAWIKERFPAQAEKGFPLKNSLGAFGNAFKPAFSPNEFEKELIAARFPFSAILPIVEAHSDIIALQAILQELACAENTPKAKKQGSSKRLTEAEMTEIIRRNRLDGHSIRVIAKEYGKSEKAIRNLFKRKGIAPKRTGKVKKEKYVDEKNYHHG